MTVQHVLDAKDDEEFEAMVIKSVKYKTSMLYGAKLMVVPKDIHQLLKMYINVLRPILTKKYTDETGRFFIPLLALSFFQSRIFSTMRF